MTSTGTGTAVLCRAGWLVPDGAELPQDLLAGGTGGLAGAGGDGCVCRD